MGRVPRLLVPLAFMALGAALYPIVSALAVEADVYWLGGTSSTGAPIFIPASSGNPLPTACI